MKERDVIVIGAGMVGAAIAYGLAQRGARVLVLDGADTDIRAARANFGLVWFQSKGLNYPAYQVWTRRAIEAWPEFALELFATSGTDVDYEHKGGLTFCLGESELNSRSLAYRAGYSHSFSVGDEFEIVQRPQLDRLLPKMCLGTEVAGALFSPLDGHANPLKLLRALHSAYLKLGGFCETGSPVFSIKGLGKGYQVTTSDGRYEAEKIVVSAGLGTKELVKQLGVELPMRPQRGQILVTERCPSLLPFPASGLRQTAEGTFMIGATQEEVGLNVGTTVEGGARMARRALSVFPALRKVNIVRQWSGLRIMTPDAYPIYFRPEGHQNVHVAVCHSGVTLAPLHASVLPECILSSQGDEQLSAFGAGRFNVFQAA